MHENLTILKAELDKAMIAVVLSLEDDFLRKE